MLALEDLVSYDSRWLQNLLQFHFDCEILLIKTVVYCIIICSLAMNTNIVEISLRGDLWNTVLILIILWFL